MGSYMLESFLYSLNIIAPIFIIVLLGVLMKHKGFIDDRFVSICDKLVFKLCLPALLFIDIATANAGDKLDLKLIVFCILTVVVSFVLPCIIVPLFIKDNAKRGAFIQGVYRSNAAILGITLATSMFGDIGAATISMVLPFVVVLFNVFAVVELSIFAPAEVKLTPKQLAKRIFKTIVTNPLIISITLALLWKLTGIELPILVDRSLNYLSNMAMPLALISLGANFTVESLHGRLGLAIMSSVCKTVIVPSLAVLCGIAFGFSGVGLGVIFILFGGPAAVSSYIMAKEMRSDYELASQILLISTSMSLFTLFGGIFILKETGLI